MPKGTLVHGAAATENLDSSGERLIIKGLDISSLESGTGTLNYEHKNDTPAHTVGKIVKARKIFSEKDCEDDHQKRFWSKIKAPFLYIVGELFDSVGHEQAKEVAAMLRYDTEKREEGSQHPNVVNFSIEGAKLEKQGSEIVRSIARKTTLTVAPCNKMAIAEQLEPTDPTQHSRKKGNDSILNGIFKTEELNDDDGVFILEKADSLPKVPMNAAGQLGATKTGKPIMSHISTGYSKGFTPREHHDAASRHYDAAQSAKDPKTASHHLTQMKYHMAARDRGEMTGARKQGIRQRAMGKTMTAGSGMGAPGAKVQGDAISKAEKLESMKLEARAAAATWPHFESMKKSIAEKHPELTASRVDALATLVAFREMRKAEDNSHVFHVGDKLGSAIHHKDGKWTTSYIQSGKRRHSPKENLEHAVAHIEGVHGHKIDTSSEKFKEFEEATGIKKAEHQNQSPRVKNLRVMMRHPKWALHVTTPGKGVRHGERSGIVIRGAVDPVNGEGEQRKVVAEFNGKKETHDAGDLEPDESVQKKSLEKGVKRRLFPFVPQRDANDPKDRLNLKTWQTYGNLDDDSFGYEDVQQAREQIQPIHPNAKKRALISLSKLTSHRRDPETGELQFLLHRGMSREEHEGSVKGKTVSHPHRSSWTPDKKVASAFSNPAYLGDVSNYLHGTPDMARGKTVSAWINAKDIAHMPIQYGYTQQQWTEHGKRFSHANTPPDYRKEFEIIVHPHHQSKVVAPRANKQQMMHRRINATPNPSKMGFMTTKEGVLDTQSHPERAKEAVRTHLRDKLGARTRSKVPKKLAASEHLEKAPSVSDDYSEIHWPNKPSQEGKYEKSFTHTPTGVRIHKYNVFDPYGAVENEHSGSIYAVTHNDHPNGEPIAALEVEHQDPETGEYSPRIAVVKTWKGHEGKGLSTLLHRTAIKEYGKLNSDYRLSPGSQHIWEKLSQDPSMKVQIEPTGVDTDGEGRTVYPQDTTHTAKWVGTAQKPKKLAASEPMAKAPMVNDIDPNDDDWSSAHSLGYFTHLSHNADIKPKTKRLSDKLFYHVLSGPKQTTHIFTSDPSGEHPIAHMLVEHKSFGPQISESIVDNDYRGKGFGQKLYLHALEHHGTLESDDVVSPHANRVYQKLARHPNIAANLDSFPGESTHKLAYRKPKKLAASEHMAKKDYEQAGLPHGWISPKGEFHEMGPDENHDEWIANTLNIGYDRDSDSHDDVFIPAYDNGWVSVGHAGEPNIQGSPSVIGNRTSPQMLQARHLMHGALESLRHDDPITIHQVDSASQPTMHNVPANHFVKFGTILPKHLHKKEEGADIENLPKLKKPYVSEAQRKWAHTPSGKKALGEKGVRHWDSASKGRKLPERKLKKAYDETWDNHIKGEHNYAGHTGVDHRPHLEAHPAPPAYIKAADDPQKILEHVPHAGAKGVTPKHVHDAPAALDSEGRYVGTARYMVKPYNKTPEAGTESYSPHSIAGWATMATKSLFHSAGLGNNTERVYTHEHRGVPQTVHHFEEYHRPMNLGDKKFPNHTLDANQIARIAAIDFLTNNMDRHAGNVLVDDRKGPEGTNNLVAIDHDRNFQYHRSLNFHQKGELSPWSKEWAPEHYVDYISKSAFGRLGKYGMGVDNDDLSQVNNSTADWWTKHRGDIMGTMTHEFQAIQDPGMKAHIERNFSDRVRYMDDWSRQVKNGTSPGVLEARVEPVEVMPKGEAAMTPAQRLHPTAPMEITPKKVG